jgi:hypothetical protein
MANKDTSEILASHAPNVLPKNPRPKPTPKPYPDTPWVHLTSPVGGEKWSRVTAQEITWESHLISSKVDLVLCTANEDIGYIAHNLKISDGSYLWELVGDYLGPGIPPPSADSGGGYYIRIQTVDGNNSDQNIYPFTINPKPRLVLTTPKGGTWQPENKLNISWNAEYFPAGTTIRLEVIRHISDIVDTFKDIPVEQGYFTWDISQSQGIESWADFSIHIVTMQKFGAHPFDFEIEASSELFDVKGWDLLNFPTMYEGQIPYKKYDGFWIRTQNSASNAGFFRDYNKGFADINVKNLIKDIAGDISPPGSDADIWERIGLLWNWLGVQGHIVEDADELNIICPNSNVWPSISEFAKYYKDNGKLVWGSCGSKAQLFANLLIQLLIPQKRFVIATTHHNLFGVDPKISQHLYIALYSRGRWFYLDPLASQATPNPKKFPDVHHACSLAPDADIPRIDYEHPYTIDAPPECEWYSPECNSMEIFSSVPYIPR